MIRPPARAPAPVAGVAVADLEELRATAELTRDLVDLDEGES